MKKSIKNVFYSTIGLVLLSLNSAHAVFDFESSAPVSTELRGTETTLDLVIQNWMDYITGFLYFIAIAMMIWGGFNIITAGGEDAKVKKGKTILIQATAGLIVIFLANSIITWLTTMLFSSAVTG